MFARSNADLEKSFSQTVHPFVNEYCVGCHSGKTPAGGLDLKAFSSLQAVIADNNRWVAVADKLAAKQMPPASMKQPPDNVRQQVVNWVRTVRATEAKKNAGDPGPVLARRLSNAEYNYTIRDLTGIDMKPTREFPVDPANQAGFDNSGESLTMSPALLAKYLQAAREVANHMVLTPDGFVFAPGLMLSETDRDQFAVKRIVDFYESQPTDYADYFEAAWRYEYRAALGHRAATLASTAIAEKVSPKYLPMVWGILGEGATPGRPEKVEVGPIAKLQAMWKSLPAPVEGKVDESALRAKCVEMRDFVVKIRKDTAMQFTAPIVKGPPEAAAPAPAADAVQSDGTPAAGPGGRVRIRFGPPRGLPPASQPLLTWKYTQFNTHRRDYDPGSLRLDTDPPQSPPVIPKYAGLHQEAAVRWAAVMKTAQLADPDLVIRAGKRAEYEESFARFANVFPDAFYIKERGKFFPDDSVDSGRLLSAGYHSVMGFWRDDLPLQQLILDDKGKKELDRLWTEFDFFADHTARTFVQFYFNQSGEVLGHGAESGHSRPVGKAVTDASVIAAIRDEYTAYAKASGNAMAAAWMPIHFNNINNTLRSLEKMRIAAEPAQLDALLKFAARAYRRPLTKAEQDDLLAYYHQLRTKAELSHEEAIRDSIVSILMSPDYLYRLDLTDQTEIPGVKAIKASMKVKGAEPLSGYALANRLSYFLWSSMPDDELMKHAAAGDLGKRDVLLEQVRRMLKDDRARGMATEFAGNLFEFRQFETYNSVDHQRFPTFTNELREAMFEEPVRFVQDVIQNDRSVLEMIYGNYTFVNPVLAKHYGMPDVKGDANTWVRVDNADKYGRGGILPMSVFLTENSPGLRTSPVKRGHWLVKDVLGEVIPPPPPVVPELPTDEAKTDLPIRQLLVKHRSNPMCAACHSRFDSLGLVFEGYGPVGEARTKDLGGRAVDASADFPGGGKGVGLEGVREYIREHRQKDFVDNLSRKLLAYALDRSLQLSDEPLINRMETKLIQRKYQFDSLVETIVTSPQFTERRSTDRARVPDSRQKIVLKAKKSSDNKGA